MRSFVAALFVSSAFITACHAADTSAAEGDGTALAQEESEADIAAMPCPDDGPRLSGTGICRGRAIAYMPTGTDPGPLPEGCEWQANETRFAMGYILYLAASCDGTTSRLGYAGGARKAVLTLEESAFGEVPTTTDEFGETQYPEYAHVFGSDPSPEENILSQVRLDLGKTGSCHVRKDTNDGMPEDALTVDVSAAEAARAPRDEPRSACGFYGYNEDEASFWRSFGGFTWFFMPTQDLYQDIVPGSMVLLREDGNGGWEMDDGVWEEAGE